MEQSLPWVDRLQQPAISREISNALRTTGCFLLEDAVDDRTCAEIVQWIDQRAEGADVERHYLGTEARIWGSQSLEPNVAEFWRQSNRAISHLFNRPAEAFTVLAIRNRALGAGDKDSLAGRWHIDSFRHQYKVFLFLNEVSERNGPFEFIPGTHAWRFKIRMASRGDYFSFSDLVSGTRSYVRLNESRVDDVLSGGYAAKPVTCRGGTVMIVNTSAIHRARPCNIGSRYALTSYFK